MMDIICCGSHILAPVCEYTLQSFGDFHVIPCSQSSCMIPKIMRWCVLDMSLMSEG